MLLAHVVPGYLAASASRRHWKGNWSHTQERTLWFIAIASTVAPDADVIYNTLVRGFMNHSLLWTHSLFPYLALAIAWLVLRRLQRWPFLQMAVGLAAVGGASHLLLDVIVHGTPLLYPLSLQMFGWPPRQIVEQGVRGYVTHPLFLLEPLLLGTAVWHWRWRNLASARDHG